jgi:outer membrane protein, multidrug efflux system
MSKASRGFALALLLAGGCAVGPDYHRPAPLPANSVPPAFTLPGPTTLSSEWKLAAPAAHLPRGAWWTVFEAPELNRLEDLADAHNQGLAGALARLEQARASVQVARADYWPQVELDPSFIRQRSSFNAPQNGQAARLSPTYNTFTAVLQSGWEADVWGRVRHQAESARANLAASTDDLEAVRLALQAEVVMDYLRLRTLAAEEALLRRTVVAYQRSLELTRNRRRGGIAADLDVSQAETQLRTAEAQVPALVLLRASVVHALASLCGQPATGFAPTVDISQPLHIPVVPVVVPSEMLERRPDVAAAERRMASANALVGVAQSAFYPHVRINGLAGFQSVDAGSWFDWPSRLWSVGPALQLPLFTGGRNRAQLDLARAAYDETVAGYRQTVLSAFQEVEDELAGQQLLETQFQADQAALAAAQRTLEVANNRYKAGLVTYLEVVTAQSSALAIESATVELRGQKLRALVGLIKALGGGWEPATQAGAGR